MANDQDSKIPSSENGDDAFEPLPVKKWASETESENGPKIPSFTEQADDASETLPLKKWASETESENGPKKANCFTEQGDDASEPLPLKKWASETESENGPKKANCFTEQGEGRKETELDSPKSSSSSGSDSGNETELGSVSGGSESGSVSDSSTDSVDSTCSAFCVALKMETLTSICRGRAAAAAASNDVDESVTVLVRSPISFLMKAFNSGWNASVYTLSTPLAPDEDFATACTVLPAAAHLTGLWFDTFTDNSPRRLPLSVCVKLYLTWRSAGHSIARYLLAKYGYEKHSDIVDFRDFFRLGRF